MHGGCGGGLAACRRREVISHYISDCDKVHCLHRQHQVMHSGLSIKRLLGLRDSIATALYAGEAPLAVAAICCPSLLLDSAMNKFTQNDFRMFYLTFYTQVGMYWSCHNGWTEVSGWNAKCSCLFSPPLSLLCFSFGEAHWFSRPLGTE